MGGKALITIGTMESFIRILLDLPGTKPGLN